MPGGGTPYEVLEVCAMTTNSPASSSSLRCKIGIHGYAKTTNDDGVSYLVCRRCGKESFPGQSIGPIPLS